jgi:hypothetical protein
MFDVKKLHNTNTHAGKRTQTRKGKRTNTNKGKEMKRRRESTLLHELRENRELIGLHLLAAFDRHLLEASKRLHAGAVRGQVPEHLRVWVAVGVLEDVEVLDVLDALKSFIISPFGNMLRDDNANLALFSYVVKVGMVGLLKESETFLCGPIVVKLRVEKVRNGTGVAFITGFLKPLNHLR